MKVTPFEQHLERFGMAQQTGILLAAGTNEMEIVEFYLDERLSDDKLYRGSYGINVAKVVEIIQQPKVTPIPMAPPGVLGTFISRGRVILLVDLAVRLGKQRPESESNPLAIVTEFNKTATAFVVSGVNRIHRLAWGRIEPAGVFLDSINCSITGVVKLEDHSVLIIDMEKVLAELNPKCAMAEDSDDDTVAAGALYTALVADDSFSIRNILGAKLAKAGFEVITANDGLDAWEQLKEMKARSQAEGQSIQNHLHIVISDIEMPRMDGYSLCQSVKKDPVLQALPVILFSSLINEKQLHKGLSVGADAQINKPESSNMAQRARELIEEYGDLRK